MAVCCLRNFDVEDNEVCDALEEIRKLVDGGLVLDE
jgi:hypothetical protein